MRAENEVDRSRSAIGTLRPVKKHSPAATGGVQHLFACAKKNRGQPKLKEYFLEELITSFQEINA